jgi:hypothetical protein
MGGSGGFGWARARVVGGGGGGTGWAGRAGTGAGKERGMKTNLGGGVAEGTGLGWTASIRVRLARTLTIIRCTMRENRTA